MEKDLDEAIKVGVVAITAKVHETVDKIILEVCSPFAASTGYQIDKEKLALAIRMYYQDENVVEIVRCKDCEYLDTEACPCTMYEDGGLISLLSENDYCSKGERRKSDEQVH